MRVDLRSLVFETRFPVTYCIIKGLRWSLEYTQIQIFIGRGRDFTVYPITACCIESNRIGVPLEVGSL